jgi:high-affinity nickel permease
MPPNPFDDRPSRASTKLAMTYGLLLVGNLAACLIIAASIVVAFFIGGIEKLGLISDKFRLDGAFWSIVAHLNDSLTNLGYAVAGIAVASWVSSSLIYRWKGYDRLPRLVR